MKNKVKGALYGLAIGDALGFPLEPLMYNERLKLFGANGVTDFVEQPDKVSSMLQPGIFSDDTQMSIAVAQALIDSAAQPYSLENVMKNIKKRFIEWLHDPENIRGPGRTCIRGVRNLENGAHWKESGIRDSKGCGAAMRTAPIGLFYQDDLDKLTEVAYASSICTHAHPTGVAAGIATAYLTYLALKGEAPETYLGKLTDFMSQISAKHRLNVSEFNRKIAEVPESLKAPAGFVSPLGQGWVGEETVALALDRFLRSPSDYRRSVLLAANTAGDCDSIACITGAISGAYNGIEGIPEEWIRDVEKSREIGLLAEELHKCLNNNTKGGN